MKALLKAVAETLVTLWKAGRYSVAFCLRLSKKWTYIRLAVTAGSTITGFTMMFGTALILNAVQHQKMLPKGAQHEMPWLALLAFTGILLVLYTQERLSWYVRNRWNQFAKIANNREAQNFRASLDVAQINSKPFDDLQKQINDLPKGNYTVIGYTEELVDLIATLISFFVYGTTLLLNRPLYALIIIGTSIPIIAVRFRENGLWWNLFKERVQWNKRRQVLETAYFGRTAFVQAMMWNQLPSIRKLVDAFFDNEMEEFEKIRRKVLWSKTGWQILAIGGLSLVIGTAVHQAVFDSTVQIGTLSIVMASAVTLRRNLEAVASQTADQWNSAKGVILINEELFALKPLITTADPIVPEFKGPPRLVFDRVKFTYPEKDDVEVLKGVSFAIEPGSKTALVGKNGSGKSTVQMLMQRLYEPTEGAIYADDINLRNIESSVWNGWISTLSQRFEVMSRTVEEEIASSRMDEPIDTERVVAAARFADFEEIVLQDPMGYKAQIGTSFGGREFSGGEYQRLAIARVRYRNTSILILDEPDASLDPEAAQVLMNKILGLEGVTVILITQHVSRTLECDRVIVMGKGEVLEQGNPRELIETGGAYASMFQKDRRRLDYAESN